MTQKTIYQELRSKEKEKRDWSSSVPFSSMLPVTQRPLTRPSGVTLRTNPFIHGPFENTYWSHELQMLAYIQRERNPSLKGELSKNLWTCFKVITANNITCLNLILFGTNYTTFESITILICKIGVIIHCCENWVRKHRGSSWNISV